MNEENRVSALLEDLKSDDGVAREEARLELVKCRAAVTDDVLPLLHDSREHVRWEAAKTLGGLGDPSVAGPLAERLGDRSTDVRWVAGESLVHLGETGARAVLQALTDEEASPLYEGAHRVLHDLAGQLPYDVRPVIAALEADEPEIAVPTAALKALRQAK